MSNLFDVREATVPPTNPEPITHDERQAIESLPGVDDVNQPGLLYNSDDLLAALRKGYELGCHE